MRIRQNAPTGALCGELAALLAEMRSERGFDPVGYIRDKVELLAEYLRRYDLSGVVVPVSGGVDSALVAALVAEASAVPDSPLRRIVYVTAPVHSPGVVTGQRNAVELAHASMGAAATRAGGGVTVERLTVDLTGGYDAIESAARTALGERPDPWARGQLAATLRTPMLYYLTSMLTAAGNPALVAGTINRDEGAWLGYVGKASDGMVDLQVISDLHKSEVYRCAELLKVPDPVLCAVPTGDMFDGAVDVEVFGAPYDFVELYLGWLCWEPSRRAAAESTWDAATRTEFTRFADALDELHTVNAHKYLVGSPAVHLDLYDSTVPGGWPERRWRP